MEMTAFYADCPQCERREWLDTPEGRDAWLAHHLNAAHGIKAAFT